MKFLLYGLAIIILYPLSVLPFRILYFFSDLFYLLLYYLLAYRRKVVRRNLVASFPEMQEKELKKVEKQFYRHLCDTIFETIKCLTVSRQQIALRCEIRDLDILDEYNEKGRSVVAVLGHFGNWEWAALSSALSVKQQMVVIYKPLSNPYFDKLINRTRARFGVQMVAMKDVFRFYFENSEKVFVNCFVADQSPQKRKSIHWTPFLNQETAVTTGPEKIAKKFDHALIFVSLEKVKRGFYHLRMKKLSESPKEEQEGDLTKMHTQALEDQVRKNPEYWLWSHKRWKYKKDERQTQRP